MKPSHMNPNHTNVYHRFPRKQDPEIIHYKTKFQQELCLAKQKRKRKAKMTHARRRITLSLPTAFSPKGNWQTRDLNGINFHIAHQSEITDVSFDAQSDLVVGLDSVDHTLRNTLDRT